MKERIIGFLTSLAMLAPAPAAFAAEPDPVQPDELRVEESEGEASLAETLTYGELTYKVVHGAVTITDCDENATNVIIPAEIEGMKVTSIGDLAFWNCLNLTVVSIPNSVISIGEESFQYCQKLTSITISDSVSSIGSSAFYGCNSLTSITIPNSVSVIGSYAFYGCGSLTSINVDSNNKNYCSVDGNLFDKNKTVLIQYAIGKSDATYSIPDSVSSIGSSAFYGCNSLTSITIPDSVSSIDWNAFHSCNSLTSITIPDSVSYIGSYAFSDCGSLTSINVDSNNKNYCSVDGHLFRKNKSVLIQYAIGKTDVTYSIPDSVSSIDVYAFYKCSSLTSITIPNSVSSIGAYAFASCNNLTNITIPNSVSSIGAYAFYKCSSLTSIIIPNSVSSIDNDAFSWCESLTNITIPNSISYIDSWEFFHCSNLTSIAIPNSVSSIRDSAFLSCNSLTDVYYSGNKEEWNNIYIGRGNGPLTKANIHYNSKAPTGTHGSTNSTSNGAPIINVATISYDGLTYDLLYQKLTIQEGSDKRGSIEAVVDNNSCKNVKVYLSQGVGTEMDITSVCKELAPGKDLSAGKDIYIVAVDEDTGKSTSRKTGLRISSIAGGKLGNQSGVDGLNFKLGQNTGFTIPDSVPVFGGTEINWSFDFIPISVEYDKEDNNKINVVFGTNITKKEGKDGREYFSDFDFKEYKKGVKKAASKQNRTLKQLRNDFKMTKDIDMKMFGGKMLSGGSGKKGNSVDVAGYAEMHVTENGLQFAEGQLCLNVEFTYNYQGQIFIWVVPLYYEFGGGAGVGFEGDMKDVNPISFSPEFEAYITGKIKGSIGAGVGIAKVATAGAEGEAALNLKKSLQNSYFKADVDGSANFNVKVFGKKVAEKKFASGNFLIYETGNSKGLISGGGVSLKSVDEGMYDIAVNAVYENESRAYADTPTLWLGGEASAELMAADYTNKDLRMLAENIYTECAPQLSEINGTKVMVMQWDNTDRADADRTMLAYSVYDEAAKAWSAPVPVDDDGTADFYPCFKDGWLVWQNEKSILTDDMTLTDIAKLGEICVSKWNGSGFDAPMSVTDNDTLDTQPQIAANGDGSSVVWTVNSENDIMGLTGRNSIMRSDFDGTVWSAPTEIKSDLNAVTNITSGSINGEFCIAYVTDDDNDFNTIDDRNIRVITSGGETRLTENDILDSCPVFANNMIYYYSGGNIMYSDIDGSNMQTVFEEAIPGLTDSFVIDGNDSGDTAVWWTKAVDGGAEVYSSLYKDGEWSNEIQVTAVGNKAKYPSGLINNDGSMAVAFNNGILENNEVVKTNLYTISVNPSYDLAITDAYFDEDSKKAYVTVANNGELAVNGVTAELTDSEPISVTEPLKAGASVEIEVPYTAALTPKNITLSIEMTEGEEYNTDNNSMEFAIGHADIEAGGVTLSADETVVSADISNIGYDSAQGVKVQLRDGSAEGAVIAEKTVNLEVGAKKNVEFTFDKAAMRFDDSSKTLYITTEGDFDEVSKGNNDGYAIVTSPYGAAYYQTEILSYREIDGKYMINSIARNNTDTEISCVLYSAVYNSEGALKACGTASADIGADNDTGVDISVPCTIESGDVIKTYMWDGQEPLSKTAELTIN